MLARFFELFRAGAAFRFVAVFFDAADLRVPPRLRADVAFRAGPRRADARFRAEVVRLREPLLLFLPPVELLRDDFLAAAMVLSSEVERSGSSPRSKL